VLTSRTLTNSSTNSSTSALSSETSFVLAQHFKWFLRSCLFASLRSPCAALIWLVISAQYTPSSIICNTLSRVPFAFFTPISILSLLLVIIYNTLTYKTVPYGRVIAKIYLIARENKSWVASKHQKHKYEIFSPQDRYEISVILSISPTGWFWKSFMGLHQKRLKRENRMRSYGKANAKLTSL
jgi:hypothetical protein